MGGDAAGVNLPERDAPVAAAGMLLGAGLMGRSVHSIGSAQAAESEGADYVIFGPVWGSATHPGTTPAGLAALAKVARSLSIPVLAIGGVSGERIAEVLASGAPGYAATNPFDSSRS